MELSRIIIKNFKKIQSLDLNLQKINYLVGGNNSGKSSALQAIHTAVTAAQSQIENGDLRVIAEEQLRYSPTGDFILLGHNRPLENPADGRRAKIEFYGTNDAGSDATYSIQLYKGRNNKNVGIIRTGSVLGFGNVITQSIPPFTVYVPGLAGIPHYEEFKNEGVLLRKVAGGEANLVLRNVLLMIKNRDEIAALLELVRKVFPEISLQIDFRDDRDQFIDVQISTNKGRTFKPIDMVGTGVLQAIQLFAYAIFFKPKILLLDEPDSHLHPSNQSLLISAFEVLAEETDTKILLATHSRHLINSAPDGAKFFWLSDGKLQSDDQIEVVKLLMDLGALDNADRILNSRKEFLFLIEDEKSKQFRLLLSNVGLTEDQYDIVPYFGVSHADAMARAIQRLRPVLRGDRKIVVHRDRDFHQDEEIVEWRDTIIARGLTPFMTSGSDLESYFIGVQHISAVSGYDEAAIEGFLRDLLDEHDAKLRKRFRDKRRNINHKLHADGGGPITEQLCPPDQPLEIRHVVGKDFLKLIREYSQEKLGGAVDPIRESDVALATNLQELIDGLRG